MERSLYERLGGEDGIAAAVQLFYDKVLEDESLAPFFAHLDIAKQVDKQVSFMVMAFGGPNEYTGRDLFTAHRRLVLDRGLSDAHFDAIVDHLDETLRELQVDARSSKEVLSIVNDTRENVLRTPS